VLATTDVEYLGVDMPTAYDPAQFDDDWRAGRPYQPFFCEENVWQLLRSGDLPAPAAAIFVTNARRTVAMWGQRAAATDPVVWDYHVVALLAQQRIILDLGDRERAAWPLADWLSHAFRIDTPARLQPRFRIVTAEQFLTTFSSDRSHMRDAAGRRLRAFPPWAAPFQATRGMNLPRFLDLADAIAGVVTDRAGLMALGPS